MTMMTKSADNDRQQQQQQASLRPTEAQLRWAQFHRKTRAQSVQTKLEKLYQTPVSPTDVPNALPEDGVTTESSSGVSGQERSSPRKRREKPNISRGRRAMLRVSKRLYESRRLQIQQYGFQCSDDKENELEEEQDDEDAIIAMFADESVLKKHRKRRASRRHRPEDDEQRVQRFEAAYHAMMMNLMPQEQPDITPAKGRWTRASHVPVAVSIDGRQYDDLKWGFTGKRTTPVKTSATPSTAPFDRRASWLVHLPRRQSTSRRLSFTPGCDGQLLEPESGHSSVDRPRPSFFSPGQMKFDELVARLQQRELESQRAQEGTPLRQREAQGKAARFREKYSRRHSSEGMSPSVENTDFLARDMYGFPYVEESPDGKSLDSQSQGGFSFGGDSEFWRSARQMHDTVPEYERQTADQNRSMSLRSQTTSNGQNREKVHDDMKASSLSINESPSKSSPGGDGESDFWRDTRKMPATSPKVEVVSRAKEQSPRDVGRPVGASQSLSKLALHQQQSRGNDAELPGMDSIVKRRVQSLMDSVDSPSVDSPSSVQRLSHDKLVPFTDGVGDTPSPLNGTRTTKTGGDSLVRRRVQDMTSPSDSMFEEAASPATGVPKLPQSKLQAFEESTNLSHTKGERAQGSDSMVKRRVDEMNRSSPGSADHSASHSLDVSRLPNGKLQQFVDSNASSSLAKNSRLQSSDSLVKRRIQDMESPSGSTDNDYSPSNVSNASHQLQRDVLGSYKEESRSSQVPRGVMTDQYAMLDTKVEATDGEGGPTAPQALRSNKTSLPEGGRTSSDLYDDSGRQVSHSIDLAGGPNAAPTAAHRNDQLGSDSDGDPGQTQSVESNAVFSAEAATVTNDTNVRQTAHKGAVAASAALRVGSKVGGMFNRVFGGNKEVDSDELKAVESFRKTQNGRRLSNDDTTSASSYRLLPDGIRRVVQNFSTRELVEQQQEDSPAALDTASQPRLPGASRSVEGEVSSREHGQLMEDTEFFGEMDAEATIIDTDGTTSDVTYDPRMDPKLAASLFLSPEILSKRLHQAIRAIERHNWEQVSYLLNANPWLAEMTDVTTGQYLLHKLALYGAGVAVFEETGGVVHVEAPAAPEGLSLNLIRMFPASVYKFDQDGNLPLHMAAVSGNQEMCRLLGERFPSGASVRNEEGLLPLHMAIQSCSSPAPSADGMITSPSDIVKTVLGFFPGSVAVVDNDGNLPIHCAAAALHGEIGVEIIYMLLDEADKQVEENGLLFRCTEMKTLDDDSVTIATDATGTPTESSAVDDSAYCNLVRNDMGHTALMVAIRARSGWEIVEALACGPGGRKAALLFDASMSNALHLLVNVDFADPASILSILKIAPEAAAVQNGEGMLPIEIACRQMMPQEVILALVLVDLPIDLDEKAGIKVREGFGGSWCFLTCECDDDYADVVEEVISICSYPQVRELCFANCGPHESGGPVITRATPKCRLALRKALRFVGRFEFLGSAAFHTDVSLGLKVFEALDFGTNDEYIEEGRRVLLRCYSREKSYLEETATWREKSFDTLYVEDMFMFGVQESAGGDKSDNEGDGARPQQFCVAVELPSLTLDRVVGGMLKNDDFHRNPDMRTRYFSKVCMVLRLVAKALRHLHEVGVVHGDVCLENCGKFDDQWKLTNLIGMQAIGKRFSSTRMGESSPPETVELLRNVVETRGVEAPSSRHVTFKGDVIAEPSIDVWAFGKLTFEVLTGESLIEFDSDKEARHDNRALLTLSNWDDEELRECIDVMKDSGVSTLGIDLVSHCLLPDPSDRPQSMDEILEHPFWKDMRKTVMSSRSRQELVEREGEKSEI